MNRADRSSPELDELFEPAKALDHVSEITRARVLARARATVAANSAHAVSPSPASFPLRRRVAIAAGAAFVLGATGAAAAYFGHAAVISRTSPIPPPRIAAPAPAIAATPEQPDVDAVTSSPSFEPPRRHKRGANVRDEYAAEVVLIRRAQAAYADANLPRALEFLGEHGRRFPNGRLAEEREALRVRSLAGCGRRTEARRALDAFAERYPHSLLLPHLQDTLNRSGAQP